MIFSFIDESENEEFYLLGYNVAYSVERQPTFRRNMSPPSSGSNYKPSKETAWKLPPPAFTLCLFCDSKDGGDVFLRNVRWLPMEYIASYPRIQNCSQPTLREPQILQSVNCSPFVILYEIISIYRLGNNRMPLLNPINIP
jgi:hypothetical protein